MSTFDELKKQLEPYKNTLVLDFFKVVRLVDVIDGEDDYYWIYDYKGRIYRGSCVLDWIPLKGYIPEDQYNNMVDIWNNNYTYAK
jgi:hypothetical protein